MAGIDGTVINVDVTHSSCVAGLTGALVAIDFVDASSIIAGMALTIVKVYFTVEARRSFGARTNIGVLSVLTCSAILTGLAKAFIDVCLTQAASVTRTTIAGKGGQSILACSIMAGIRVAFIDIDLTVLSCVTFSTLACVLIGTVCAFSPILAGCTGALIDVHLTQIARKTFRTLAMKRVYLVNAFSIVETWLDGTFVCVNVAKYTLISWHANTVKTPNLIQTCCVIMAGVRHALIDIHLTARPFISLKAFTLERSFGVKAPATMFTWVGSKRALIYVQVAGRPRVTRWAGTNCLAIYWVGVTIGSLLAWVADAGIIKVAQQACASMWALAEERGNTVMAGSPMIACCTGTVINVLTAVITCPTVHTDTVVASMSIMACPSILARIGHQLAFIYVFCAILSCVMRRTLAVIGVYSIHTDSTVLTVVAWAIVNVVFTVWTGEAWQTAAVISCVPLLNTCASVLAW